MGVDFIIDTPEGIALYRLLAIQHRLRLEIRGFTFKGRPILSILKSNGDIAENIKTKKRALEIIEKKISSAKEEYENG